MQAMRVGLMGGTFDPIHYGHLFLAEEARVRCQLDQVIFFPNHQPAHKQGKRAHVDPATRFELTALGIKHNSHFQLSRIEIDRPGPSYAFDTLHRFQEQFQQELGKTVELFYIVGADSMEEVLTWYRGAELFELCGFIAGTRPGYSLEVARAQLTPQQLARVEWLEIPGLHIASSELRQRVQAGLPIRYLTPDIIVEEIVRRGLYRES